MAKLDVAGSLKKKIGPQPAWAWLLEGTAGLWWWRKTHASSTLSGSSSGAQFDPYAAAGGYSDPYGGSGSTGGGSGSGTTDPGVPPASASVPGPDQSAVSGVPTLGDSVAGGETVVGGNAVSGASTTGLLWAGQTFTSQADFKAYLKKHGLSVAGFAAKHPAAYAIYLGLPKGGKAGALRAKLTGKKKASGSKKRQTVTAKAPKGPRHRKTADQATPHHTGTRAGATTPSAGKTTRHRATTHHPAGKPKHKQSRVRGSHGGTEPTGAGRGGDPTPPKPTIQPRRPYQTPAPIIHHQQPKKKRQPRHKRVVHHAYRGRH